MTNSTQILIDIRELSNEMLDQGFLTDDKLRKEADYKGWEFSMDIQTGAALFLDPRSGLEMYCSPCFENDWGTIYFSVNNIYGNGGFGDVLGEVVEVDIKPYFGDIDKQKEVWRENAYHIIDNVETLVPGYYDIVAEHLVSEKVYEIYSDNEYVDTMNNDKATHERIEFLKECLVAEFKKVKSKK
jgi:hypothetical protein